jgi:biotin carboxylase
MSNRRVLVVGTTSDYIESISRRYPQRALFITDVKERAKATEPRPVPGAELVCELRRPDQVVAALRKHLERWSIEPAGTACFDCESMSLAAFISRTFGLCYPSSESVAACRSKYISKQFWRQGGLPCPGAGLVHNASDAVSFFRRADGPVVLKPLTGSGSELVFLCSNEDECIAAFGMLKLRLADHANERMYASYLFDGNEIDPRNVFVIEEFIGGEEYSCDFLVDSGKVEILRMTRKIPDREQSFGTTLAYVLLAEYPPVLADESFRGQLCEAARVLGLDRAICMLDFVVKDNQAFMIELTPRPGGDCLPALLLKSCGIDIPGVALDFAEGRPLKLPKPSRRRSLVGVRLFATQSGEIKLVDSSVLSKDSRVVECHLKRGSGHRVFLPPEEYESRVLGHVIFKPTGSDSIEKQCVEINSKLKVEMKTEACARVN